MEISEAQALDHLAELDPYEFERLVADLWARRGWSTRVTQDSADRGVDVIAEKQDPFHQKQLIQAKRWARDNKVGSPDIQQYSSLRQQEERVDSVVVVTTSSFSLQAEQTAEDLNVKLIDGYDLYSMIRQEELEKLLQEYVDFDSGNQVGESPANEHESPAEISKSESLREISDLVEETGEGDFPKCPICAERGEVGFREGKCGCCDTTWGKESHFFKPNKWTASSAAKSETPRTAKSWQQVLHPDPSESTKKPCPLCGGYALWTEGHPLECDECGTTWVKDTRILRENLWRTIGGPDGGSSLSADDWREKAQAGDRS